VDDGTTPIMIASCFNHLETVKVLVQKGSNINAKVNGGNTALSFAEEYGNKEVATFLRQQSKE